MTEVDTLNIVGSLATAIATIALVFLLWRTMKQMEHTVKLSKIQAEFRFRPWIGPTGGIKHLDVIDGKHQFSITIKNYGEIPAERVIVKYKMDTKPMERKAMLKSDDTEKFNLGPLLPNMEKNYWVFIDDEMIKKNQNEIFIFLYFEYDVIGKSSGYGMISEFDVKSNNFIHKDMWVTEIKI